MFFSRRNRRNTELDTEIASHIEMGVRERIERGESAEAARAATLREFGNVSLVKQTTREMWGWNAFEQLKNDLQYALRTLRKSKAFTVTAAATLALGIGAATVIFSVADHIAFRALPYPNASRLFVAHEVIVEMSDKFPALSSNASHYLAWKQRCLSCDAMGAIRPVSIIHNNSANVGMPGSVRISASVFQLLGATPLAGRLLTEKDELSENERVVVVSNAFWRTELGSDKNAVGKTILLNNEAWLIVGVLNNDFVFPKGNELGPVAKLPAATDLFIPLALNARERTTPGEFDYSVIGRVSSTATLAQAHAQLAAVQVEMSKSSAEPMTFQVVTTPLQEQIVGASASAMLFLLGAVGAILLIVCVNLANLQLARHANRSREAAVRVALGAKPARLVRQALTESVVLAAIGGVTGILLSHWGLAALLQLAPADTPRLNEVRLDTRVVAIAICVSVLTGLVFGVFPALRMGRVNAADVLKAGGRTTDARGAHRTRSVLIASQVGLSAALLYATGLFLSSFVRVMNVDKGFTATSVLAVDITLPRNVYFTPTQRSLFHDELLKHLAETPGVTTAAITSFMPLEGEMQVDGLAREHDTRPMVERPVANMRYVSPSYFATLGIRSHQGRFFEESDRGRAVVVLSEEAARKLWPGGSPIGKRVVPGSNDSIAEVVGIVSDVKTTGMEAAGSLIVYMPYWQRPPFLRATVLVSTESDPRGMISSVRRAIAEVGRAVPVSRVRTIQQIVSAAVAQRRFQLALMLLFATSALAVASIGIYGIISHALSRRANEIGVRMALGARPAQVHRLVLMEVLRPATIGLLAGVTVAVVLGQVFRALLFEVSPANPITMAGVAAILLFVAAIACYVPARRSTKGGVSAALRAD